MKSNQGSFVKRALMVGLLAGSGVLAMTSFAMSGAGPAGGCDGKPVAEMGAGMNAKSAASWDARRDAHLAALKQTQLQLGAGSRLEPVCRCGESRRRAKAGPTGFAGRNAEAENTGTAGQDAGDGTTTTGKNAGTW